ncbi:MAG: hypothetical protein LBU12_01255 [Deltaproteobacteria bacterium]|nr:hypothetical protein [Deltaproteobacteria bacterium]
MSINSILFSASHGLQEPILLNVGSKSNNYESLATYLAQQDQTSETTQTTDKVDLALEQVAGKIVTELAGLTAQAIGDHPELADDYVLAVIDSPGGREVRVYSRQEIVDAYEGTEAEKAALLEQLTKEPLVAYDSAESLPATSQGEGYQDLAAKANAFLKTNAKLLDMLDKYGFNPFANLKEA